MKYTNLGRSGLQVSRLCLGMMSYGASSWQPWVLPAQAGEHFVRRALDSGINFFDTADFYSYGASEEILGKAIAEMTSRDQVVLSTKAGLPMRPGANGGGLSRKHIRESLHASLRRLRTDYVDVFLLHQPDPCTSLEETLDAVKDLVREGKILYFGASNFPAWMLAKAAYTSRHSRELPVSVAQIQYNLCYREDERDVLPLSRDEGLGLMVYSPLARGWLAGNRAGAQQAQSKNEAARAATDAKAHSLYGSVGDRAVLARVMELAQRRDVPPARVAMSWVLSRPEVSAVLCGVLDDSHLDEALLALDLDLDPDDIAFLESAYQPQALKETGLGAVLGSAASPSRKQVP